jgi:GNAT superfamily N-acetyltransferase
MEIKEEKKQCEGIKFYIEKDGKEIGRATLYLMTNDLHDEPFGLLEDVLIDESLRGQGMGTTLVKKVIEEAKNQKCYKLIATSRHSRERVHKLYESLGFKDHGLEFRMDF